MECDVQGFREWAWCRQAKAAGVGWGAEGSEEGALETSCNLPHPCQPWVAFLLLLVYLTGLIGTPYACLRTHVHSRLVLRAERNRKFHLNSTDFKHLNQVPQGRLGHPGRWVRQPGDALEGQQGAPQSQEEGHPARTRAGNSGKTSLRREQPWESAQLFCITYSALFRNEVKSGYRNFEQMFASILLLKIVFDKPNFSPSNGVSDCLEELHFTSFNFELFSYL